MHDNLYVIAAEDPQGRRAIEEIHVEHAKGGSYRVLNTPALVEGVAAGDTVITDGKDPCKITVVLYGGRAGVQFFWGRPFTEEEEQIFAAELAKHGATVEGLTEDVLTTSFDASLGFEVIQESVRLLRQMCPTSEWYYANVYAADGKTPLPWTQAVGTSS